MNEVQCWFGGLFRHPALWAAPVKVQRVVAYFEVHYLGHGISHVLDARIAELHHLAAFGADHVIVLAKAVRTLVLGLLRAELVFAHQPCLHQQVHGVVQGGPAHAVLRQFHTAVQLLDIEVAVQRVDLLQNGEALRCFAVPALLQVVAEEALYALLDIGGGHWVVCKSNRCR